MNIRYIMLFCCLFTLINLDLSKSMTNELSHATLHNDDLPKNKQNNAEHEELLKDFSNLDWKAPGTYKLSNSHSILTVPSGYIAVLGEEAVKARLMLGESHIKSIQSIFIEAFIFSPEKSESDEGILITCLNDFHVSLDDWEEVDSIKLKHEINEYTNQQNTGIAFVRWIQEPMLDKPTNTVFMVREYGGSKPYIVSNALKLGKTTVEMFTWTTKKSLFIPSINDVVKMFQMHDFDQGYHHEDYISEKTLFKCGIDSFLSLVLAGKRPKMIAESKPAWALRNLVRSYIRIHEAILNFLGDVLNNPPVFLLILVMLFINFFVFRNKKTWSGERRIAFDFFWSLFIAFFLAYVSGVFGIGWAKGGEFFFDQLCIVFGRMISTFFLIFFWSWRREQVKNQLVRLILQIFCFQIILIMITFLILGIISPLLNLFNPLMFLMIFMSLLWGGCIIYKYRKLFYSDKESQNA